MGHVMRVAVASVLAVASLFIGSAGAATPSFTITDLGSTLGGRDSFAGALNAQGQIVGSSVTSIGVHHAVLWQDGELTDLNAGGIDDEFSASFASDINERGQVVGTQLSFRDPDLVELPPRAALWQDGEVTYLPPLGGVRDSSGASAINNRGQIAGASWRLDPGPFAHEIPHAVLWQDGEITDLGTLGGETSGATALNNRGQVVGWSVTETGLPSQAFLWKDGVMRAISNSFSRANDINGRGQIVGLNFKHASLWENGLMRDLGTLGGENSEAFAINERGQVVGWSETASGEGHAFLWQDGVMFDLGTLGGAESSANGINESGQVVGVSETASSEAFPPSHAVLWSRSP